MFFAEGNGFWSNSRMSHVKVSRDLSRWKALIRKLQHDLVIYFCLGWHLAWLPQSTKKAKHDAWLVIGWMYAWSYRQAARIQIATNANAPRIAPSMSWIIISGENRLQSARIYPNKHDKIRICCFALVQGMTRPCQLWIHGSHRLRQHPRRSWRPRLWWSNYRGLHAPHIGEQIDASNPLL